MSTRLLAYPGFPGHNLAGRCDLRVYDSCDGGPAVAVASERPDNEGPSITNVAESVWREVAGMFPGIPLRYVEHYPPRGRLPATYDRVTFDARGNPQWAHLPAEQVEAMIGELP